MGLGSLALDPVGTAAGQKHAEEMAAHRYLSHWDLDGKLPDQRYTEAGGKDHVQENVYFEYRYAAAQSQAVYSPDSMPTFSRAEIEAIEAAYFNERPPHDGHRQNILGPNHTHVGIALAKARSGDGSSTTANTQEFIDRAVAADPIPKEAKVGDKIVVTGTALRGYAVRAVLLSRDALPRGMDRDQLQKTSHYATPAPFAQYTPGEPGRALATSSDGAFRADVILSDDGRPGIYYVVVFLRSSEGRSVVGSQRTVVVR